MQEWTSNWAEHERFMRVALAEAQKAADADEVPVGAVVVHQGRIIGKAHNQRELLRDPTAHAEMLAITQAASALEAWRVEDTTIYVTLEPCAMCAGAMVLARIRTLVYGAQDPKAGACASLYNIPEDARLNHRLEVVRGVLAEDCAAVLTAFFKDKRGFE